MQQAELIARYYLNEERTFANYGIDPNFTIDHVKGCVSERLRTYQTNEELTQLLQNCVVSGPLKIFSRRKRKYFGNEIKTIREFLKDPSKRYEVNLECIVPNVELETWEGSRVGLSLYLVPKEQLNDVIKAGNIESIVQFKVDEAKNYLAVTRNEPKELYTFTFEGMDRVPWLKGRIGNANYQGKFVLAFKGYALMNDRRVEISHESPGFQILSHSSQRAKSWTENLWESAFCKIATLVSTPPEAEYTGRFENPDAVHVDNVVELFSLQFEKHTKTADLPGRGFNCTEKQFLAELFKSLTGNSEQRIKIGNITEKKCGKFAFCEWIYKSIQICTNEFVKKCWNHSYIQLLSEAPANELLKGKGIGTFVMRFTNSKVGEICFQYVCDDQGKIRKSTRPLEGGAFVKRFESKMFKTFFDGVCKFDSPIGAKEIVKVKENGYSTEEDEADSKDRVPDEKADVPKAEQMPEAEQNFVTGISAGGGFAPASVERTEPPNDVTMRTEANCLPILRYLEIPTMVATNIQQCSDDGWGFNFISAMCQGPPTQQIYPTTHDQHMQLIPPQNYQQVDENIHNPQPFVPNFNFGQMNMNPYQCTGSQTEINSNANTELALINNQNCVTAINRGGRYLEEDPAFVDRTEPPKNIADYNNFDLYEALELLNEPGDVAMTSEKNCVPLNAALGPREMQTSDVSPARQQHFNAESRFTFNPGMCQGRPTQ